MNNNGHAVLQKRTREEYLREKKKERSKRNRDRRK